VSLLIKRGQEGALKKEKERKIIKNNDK